MNVTINDPDSLISLGAGEVSTYLRSRGWLEDKLIEDRAAIWHIHTDDGEEFETLVPQKRSLDDYALRMRQLLGALSVVESRSELDIYTDIQNTQTDTVRLRFSSSLFSYGSVPLSDAARMIEATRDMTLAAACATVNPRSAYAKRKPQEAMDFLKKIRMGKTERGSFIISLHAPVPPRLHIFERPQTSKDIVDETSDNEYEKDEPFERRVTLMLARSLKATLLAVLRAQAKGDLAPFEESVSQGVNANLCDALADLGLETSTQSLSIDFQWSPTRTLLRNAPNSIELQTDQFTVLREAAKRFRDIEPTQEYESLGFVVKLERPADEQEGWVTLADYSERKPRHIRIFLEEHDYKLAYEAHGRESPVQCSGVLKKEGRSFILKNPYGFTILD